MGYTITKGNVIGFLIPHKNINEIGQKRNSMRGFDLVYEILRNHVTKYCPSNHCEFPLSCDPSLCSQEQCKELGPKTSHSLRDVWDFVDNNRYFCPLRTEWEGIHKRAFDWCDRVNDRDESIDSIKQKITHDLLDASTLSELETLLKTWTKDVKEFKSNIKKEKLKNQHFPCWNVAVSYSKTIVYLDRMATTEYCGWGTNNDYVYGCEEKGLMCPIAFQEQLNDSEKELATIFLESGFQPQYFTICARDHEF